MPFSAQRQFLVKVSTISGYFSTKTGGETTSETTDVWDGGARRPEKIASPPSTDNLVIGRPYRPERDQPVIARLRPLVGAWRTTVSVQPTDADLVPVGNPEVFPDALLVGISSPEVDSGSGDSAMLQLTFGVENVA